LDWIETSMSRDVLIQASMLPDAVRNAKEDEVYCTIAANSVHVHMTARIVVNYSQT